MNGDAHELPKNIAQTVLEAGVALAKPFEINGIPAVLLPEGAELKTLEELALTPQRVEQKVELDTVESFLQYYNTFAMSNSLIICNLQSAKFTAVLDYHDRPNDPNWCRHMAFYQCPRTLEWGHWKDADGKTMDQVKFATFIEDHLPDIVAPAGADMLEIAKTLHAVKGVNFRKAIRLDNGENQLLYEEKIEGSAGEKGQFSIPQIFKIGVRLFEGGPAYELEARFRYRIDDARLSLWYDLVRPHKATENAVLAVHDEIKAGMRQGQILRGRWVA